MTTSAELRQNFMIAEFLYHRFAYLLSGGSGINRLMLDKIVLRTLKSNKFFTVSSINFLCEPGIDNIEPKPSGKSKAYLHYDLISISKTQAYKSIIRLRKAGILFSLPLDKKDTLHKYALNIPGCIDLVASYLTSLDNDVLKAETKSLSDLKTFFMKCYQTENVKLSWQVGINLNELKHKQKPKKERAKLLILK